MNILRIKVQSSNFNFKLDSRIYVVRMQMLPIPKLYHRDFFSTVNIKCPVQCRTGHFKNCLTSTNVITKNYLIDTGTEILSQSIVNPALLIL
jgi:hypothetical protein